MFFKKIKFAVASSVALAVTSITSASAAVTVTGITDSVTDVETVGAAIISVLVAVAAFKYIRRAF